MTSQGAKLSSSECNEIINEADRDGDGEINLEGKNVMFTFYIFYSVCIKPRSMR